jgi:hypothetical protein
MKNLMILVTMLLSFGFANAQSKIYNSEYPSSSRVVGCVKDGKIYNSEYPSSSRVVGCYEGGMLTGYASAMLLLL